MSDSFSVQLFNALYRQYQSFIQSIYVNGRIVDTVLQHRAPTDSTFLKLLHYAFLKMQKEKESDFYVTFRKKKYVVLTNWSRSRLVFPQVNFFYPLRAINELQHTMWRTVRNLHVVCASVQHYVSFVTAKVQQKLLLLSGNKGINAFKLELFDLLQVSTIPLSLLFHWDALESIVLLIKYVHKLEVEQANAADVEDVEDVAEVEDVEDVADVAEVSSSEEERVTPEMIRLQQKMVQLLVFLTELSFQDWDKVYKQITYFLGANTTTTRLRKKRARVNEKKALDVNEVLKEFMV